jgi:uncharacterized protein (UPF0333 family)
MNENYSVIKPIQQTNKNLLLILVSVVAALGLATGFFLSSKQKAKSPITSTNQTASASKEAGANSTNLKDTATGILRTGGIKGEGTYHLEREGGESQTVYLTSTAIDMSPFVGKKVQVWGQTLASKYAPWFIDVGKVKVVE